MALRAALIAGLTPDQFNRLLPWQLFEAIDCANERRRIDYEIAYGAAWVAERGSKGLRELLAQFRKPKAATPDWMVAKAWLERTVMQAEAEKRRKPGA